MDRVPRHLIVLPLPELSRPGIELSELRLRAHDGEPLRALLSRPAFGQCGERVQLRPAAGESGLGAEHVDWPLVERGGTDLAYRFPPGRRLEDRVMDVVRIARAACCLEAVDCSRLEFGSCGQNGCDELVIAEWLRNEGWIAGRPGMAGPR